MSSLTHSLSLLSPLHLSFLCLFTFSLFLSPPLSFHCLFSYIIQTDRAYLEDRLMSFFQDTLPTHITANAITSSFSSSSSSRSNSGHGINALMPSVLSPSPSHPYQQQQQHSSNTTATNQNNQNNFTSGAIGGGGGCGGSNDSLLSSSNNMVGTNHLPARL